MNKDCFIYNFLEEAASKWPDRRAVLYDTFEVTYKQLFEDVIHKAIHMQRFPGQRVAIYGPSSYRWIVNTFGTIVSGKDVVLVDFFLPTGVRHDLLAKASVEYTLSSTNQYILADKDSRIIKNAEKDDVTGAKLNLKNGEGNILMFTATGGEYDKAAVLTSENLVAAASAVNSRISCGTSDIVLTPISMHRIFSFLYSLMWPLSNGACVAVGRGLRHIDADTYYYDVTVLPITPAMARYLARVNGYNKELKTIIVGEAKCPKKYLEVMMSRGVEAYNVYGALETTGCIGIGKAEDESFELFDGVEVSIASDGEILVGGSMIMAGYETDPEYTAKALEGGVYHTKDYGEITSDGRVHLKKTNPDLIQLATGEKISKKVTSKQISELNGIADTCVIKYADILTAIIVPVNKNDTEARIRHLIDKYNANKGYRWEIQRIVVSPEALPLDKNGEHDEKKIIEKYLA